METNISVTNCRLRIVRRGGWSWGTTRREIANRAAQALPELILQRIAAQVRNLDDAEITSPVVLQIVLKRKELLKLLSEGNLSSDRSSNSIVASIDEAIKTSGLGKQIEQFADVNRNDATSGASPSSSDQVEVAVREKIANSSLASRLSNEPLDTDQARTSRISSLLNLIENHFSKGTLALFLNQLSTATLVEWDQVLSRLVYAEQEYDSTMHRLGNSIAKIEADYGAAQPHSNIGLGRERSNRDLPIKAGADSFDELNSLVLRITDAMPIGAELKARLCYRIHATLVAYAEHRVQPNNILLRRLLDQHLPIEQGGRNVASAAETEDQVKLLGAKRHDGERFRLDGRVRSKELQSWQESQPSSSGAFDQAWIGEVDVDSVLPFLLLGPLTQAKYIETLAVALDAAGLEDHSQVFAFSLASKVFPLRVSGQLPDRSALISAATFAGTPNQLYLADARDLTANADTFVSPLNAQLANELLSDYPSDAPLVLSQMNRASQSRMILSDPRGQFPIAILRNVAELDQVLCRCDSQLLLVSTELANYKFLEHLNCSGRRFLMELPPIRGESYRSVRDGYGKRYWTNDTVTAPHRLAKAGSILHEQEQAMADFWGDDKDHVATCNTTSTSLFDDSLTLAAGVALAQVAWELWRDREPTHPLLTLDRFADLSGVVRFTPNAVEVRLPMGRRAADLASHGLMEDIPFVPWLHGRRVAFCQG